MNELNVRQVELESMRVVAALGYGESPEAIAMDTIYQFANKHGFLENRPRCFGFNNRSPSAGNPNYGYEFWMQVSPEVEPDETVKIKEFSGGAYLVTRVKGVDNIFPGWQKLVTWAESSPYRIADRQCLEEMISAFDAPLDELTLDLYLPVEPA